jgi:hypothetical protein
VLFLLVVLIPVSCLPSVERDSPRAGFWWGVWHGAVSVVSFTVSIFNPDVRIYQAHNHRFWYDLGFIIGLVFSGWFATSSAEEG